MIYIPEKEKIVRKNRWTTNYSKLFFNHKRKNCEKFLVYGGCNHGFVVEDKTGELLGFGMNSYYQLGLGDNDNRTELVPIKFFSSKRIIKICCGKRFSIFLTAIENKVQNKQLLSAGFLMINAIHQSSLAKFPFVFDIKEFDVLDVFVGYFHTVVLSKSLEVYSFGVNSSGELGVGDFEEKFSPTKVILSERILSAFCGECSTFFISIEGNLFACGNRNKHIVSTPKKILFFGKEKILQVRRGRRFTLFLTENNQVFGVGQNRNGELGVGDIISKTIICMVASLRNEKIISIKCGESHSYFRSKEKTWMSGWNYFSQMNPGDKDWISRISSPKLFTIEGKRIIQSLMLSHSVIHFTENEVYGSGCNDYGQLFSGKADFGNIKTFKIRNLKVKERKINNVLKLKETLDRFEYLNLIVKEKKKTNLFFFSF